ncbi:class II fructose-bisphosphate aldolase, partial [Escherichia coli]|uniref:class II fructose-bisphosphate aldolase n=2 Tax=Escherichia coli TaxID=562 RepID=UPI00207B5014
LLLCHGMVCVVGRMRDLILQLSKSSIYSTKPRTGCDSLAVAIGNQHGVYTSEPQLNFEVVKRVRDAVSVPLVLHGASGISDADIKTAISLGIAKINIHTELCQAAMVAVKENQDQPFLHLEREVRKAVKERALEKIKLFGSDGKAE